MYRSSEAMYRRSEAMYRRSDPAPSSEPEVRTVQGAEESAPIGVGGPLAVSAGEPAPRPATDCERVRRKLMLSPPRVPSSLSGKYVGKAESKYVSKSERRVKKTPSRAGSLSPTRLCGGDDAAGGSCVVVEVEASRRQAKLMTAVTASGNGVYEYEATRRVASSKGSGSKSPSPVRWGRRRSSGSPECFVQTTGSPEGFVERVRSLPLLASSVSPVRERQAWREACYPLREGEGGGRRGGWKAEAEEYAERAERSMGASTRVPCGTCGTADGLGGGGGGERVDIKGGACTMEEWLRGISLQQYTDAIKEYGYDSLEVLDAALEVTTSETQYEKNRENGCC